MPITGLILSIDKPYQEEFIDWMKSIPGTSVKEGDEKHLVVVTDTSSDKEDKELWGKFENHPQVDHISMVFHNREDIEE